MPEGQRRLGLYYRDMRFLSNFNLSIDETSSRGCWPHRASKTMWKLILEPRIPSAITFHIWG